MKRIVRKTMAYLLILAIVVFSFRLYMISSKEVVDTTQFTDYFQLDEADNGGLELTTSNFTTFEKEYNFVKEEKVEEDKKEGEKEKEKEKPAPPPPPKRAEQITYKVKKKDTIPAIAKRYGIKQDTILMNNKNAASTAITKKATILSLNVPPNIIAKSGADIVNASKTVKLEYLVLFFISFKSLFLTVEILLLSSIKLSVIFILSFSCIS